MRHEPGFNFDGTRFSTVAGTLFSMFVEPPNNLFKKLIYFLPFAELPLPKTKEA
jgi:hypothetical protein